MQSVATSGIQLREPHVRPFLNRNTVAALAAVTVACLWVGNNLVTRDSTLDHLYLLMIVQLTPFLIAITRKHFTYISLIMLMHLSTYSVAKYNRLTDKKNLLLPAFDYVRQALNEQTYCSILIILVYYASRQFLFVGHVEKERYQYLSLTRTHVLLMLGYVMIVPLMVDYLPAWFLIVHYGLLGADIVMVYTSISPGNQRLMAMVKLTVVITAFLSFLKTGMLMMLAHFAQFYFVVALLRRDLRRLAIFGLMLLLLSVMQSVKVYYRYIIQEDPSISMVDRFFVLTGVVNDHFFEGRADEEPLEELDDNRVEMMIGGFNRVGDDSLERVLSLTPKKVPYWEGETYASLPFLFIPRVLWPDKPSRHFWNRFGRVYGVLSEDDYATSVGVSYIAEGYMNFGYLGMYGIAMFVGFLFAFVERLSYVIARGYYFFTFIIFMTPLTSSAIDLGSMLNSIFLLTILSLALRRQILNVARRDEYS